jgi:DNA-directed RNA polymerase subunit RPC12/RpoP
VQQTEFQCAGCGATLQYSPGTTLLVCPYCGRENQLQVTGAPIVEHDLVELSVVPHTTAQGFDAAVREFKCNRCGATTTLAGAQMATRCAFCGSDVVVEAPPQPGMIRPESLVPFALDKQSATQRFQAWLQGLWFRPSNLKRMAGLAKIDGMYTPHFTYDANAHSRWSGEAGYYYYETEWVTIQGRRQSRQVRKVRWVRKAGLHDFFYDDELVCASRGLPLNIVAKVYPFHLNALVPYAPEFLSGFGAEAYTVDPREGWNTARQAMESKERQACSRLLGGDTQRNLVVQTQFSSPKFKHILLPLYVAAYVFGAKTYRFLVNGQTGEVQGEAPISWAKVGAVVGGVVLAIVAITKLAGLW